MKPSAQDFGDDKKDDDASRDQGPKEGEMHDDDEVNRHDNNTKQPGESKAPDDTERLFANAESFSYQ